MEWGIHASWPPHMSSAGERGQSREPPRVSRRPQTLSGWVYDETRPVFSGSAEAGGAEGVRARAGTCLAVDGDHLNRREDRVRGRDPATVHGLTGLAMDERRQAGDAGPVRPVLRYRRPGISLRRSADVAVVQAADFGQLHDLTLSAGSAIGLGSGAPLSRARWVPA
jgi:hypothetical protein